VINSTVQSSVCVSVHNFHQLEYWVQGNHRADGSIL